MKNGKLWSNIKAFVISTPTGTNVFLNQVAIDNNVSLEHAARLFEEYLKFIYLAATHGGKLTPSKMVDEVWHAHLKRKTSYWVDLCQNILGKEITHHTGLKGEAEENNSAKQYLKTIAIYFEEFGIIPPSDIWPLGDYSEAEMRSNFEVQNLCEKCARKGFRWARPICMYCGNEQFEKNKFQDIRSKMNTEFEKFYKAWKASMARYGTNGEYSSCSSGGSSCSSCSS